MYHLRRIRPFLFPAFVICSLFSSAPAAITGLSVDSLTRLLSSSQFPDLVVIDLRESSEITNIIGVAACRPYNLPFTSGIFAQNYSTLDISRPVAVYCASGFRSGRAAAFLDSCGYTQVLNLSGGFNGWTGPVLAKSSLLPLAQFPQTSRQGTSLARPAAPDASRAGPRLIQPAGVRGVLVAGKAGFWDLQGRMVLIPREP